MTTITHRLLFFLHVVAISIYIYSPITNAATINATSCSGTHVTAAITTAVSGDTVVVPSGTATWSSSISIPSAKDLSIIGGGIDNTVITCSSGTCFTIAHEGSSSESRISGFTFNSGVFDMGGIDGTKPVRIDHNKFTSTSTLLTWSVAGWTSGIHPSVLFDNNVFHNHRIVVDGTKGELVEGDWQHELWEQEPPSGGWPYIVYIESNTITTSGITANMPDAARGGRFVFRFNTIDDDYTEVHGVQGNVRAAQWWEIYHNDYTNNPWTMMFIRGGSGLVFNNTSDADDGIRLNVERSCSSVSTALRCNGSSPWDGNTPSGAGYPCRDQIGRSQDTSLWTVGDPYPDQEDTPAYIFNNKYGANELSVILHNDCSDQETYHTFEDRDYFIYESSFDGTSGVGAGVLGSRPATCTTGVGYWATDQGSWNADGDDGILYKCTSTDTWEQYYVPYDYPHPLIGGASASITGCTISGGSVQ